MPLLNRQSLHYLLWAVCATLWVTLCFIAPDFSDNPIDGFRGACTVAAYIAACGIGAFFVVYLIGCNRYVCWVLLPLLGILGAGVSFYRVAYRVTVTPMIIDVTLHTNAEEAAGVISWQMVGWAVLNIAIAAAFCYWRASRIRLQQPWVHAVAALLLGAGYFCCNSRLQQSLCQRYPYNIAYNLSEYAALRRAILTDRLIPPYSVQASPDSLTIVLVLGEAVRADHLQLNGYERPTTPRMLQRRNIVSLPDIYTDQTHTLASLPYILTRADSANETPQFTESSFVSIFRQEGYRTSWLSNQDMGSTFMPFLNECDTIIFANAGKSVYVFSPWFDEELLPVLDSLEAHATPRELYIVHPIGSHWYYNNHVPEHQWYFRPVTTNRLVTANEPEQVINSYDNTVRYMDYVLDGLIGIFEHKNALVIYQADHSEALGEDGLYLHANDAEAAKHPACIIWYSDRFAQNYPAKVEALLGNAGRHYRTDYVFYSLLSAAGITAEGDRPEMNIFTPADER